MARTKPNPAPSPIAVTDTHAAAMLDCSRQHVRNLVERGELRFVRIGTTTSVRIPVADIYRVLGLCEAGDAT